MAEYSGSALLAAGCYYNDKWNLHNNLIKVHKNKS